MNADKLAELERKWRAEVDVDPPSEYDTGWNECTVKCADELAALRAEQAVGEEQIARELLDSCAAGRIQRPDGLVEVGQAVDAVRRALGAARQPESRDHEHQHSCSYYCDRPECIKVQRDELREAYVARQSEGVGKVFGMEVVHNPKLPPDSFVLVPREPTLDMKRAGSYAVSCLTHDGAMVCYRAMLAAAPGGEGEG